MGTFYGGYVGARTQQDDVQRAAERSWPNTAEDRARETLGYHGPLGDADAIKEAFARAVKEAHPDTGGKGADMMKLKEARQYLLSRNISEKTPCPMCKGVGMVAVGNFGQQCQNCKGTGLKP